MNRAQKTDETALTDLISRAKAGDEDAFARLLEQYASLVESLARRFGAASSFSEQDRQDLRQEATIAFCRAIDRFDAQDGVTFGYFAKICVENRLISWSRKQLRERAATTGLSEEAKTDAHPENPADFILEQENYLELCRQIRGLLSDYENRIWTLFISGHTAAEIAELLGTEKRSVENAVFRVRRKLRNRLPHR